MEKRVRAESTRITGPLRSIDDIMPSATSAISIYETRPDSSKTAMSWQAALHVVVMVKWRAATRHT